jgi:hypothetical protein
MDEIRRKRGEGRIGATAVQKRGKKYCTRGREKRTHL